MPTTQAVFLTKKGWKINLNDPHKPEVNIYLGVSYLNDSLNLRPPHRPSVVEYNKIILSNQSHLFET
ncbi:hypothetical protein LEP1GSC125_4013 [Leptospira mayottensis 200901122]|uniref:Uncharacterized protein n=1 Tax=Leptospira mayottensis 200901122 TaxID=1193010 RepID=A0AA87MQJ4_9LEPT|nr:hypothetical protein [Leptospira mayottensis]EKS01870.1 hypothetical protein LEP1GSC125_4013 [Leptospira mayottensis 200901122]